MTSLSLMLGKRIRTKDATTLRALNGGYNPSLVLKLRKTAFKKRRGGWFFPWPKVLNGAFRIIAERSAHALTQHAKNDILYGEGRKIMAIIPMRVRLGTIRLFFVAFFDADSASFGRRLARDCSACAGLS